MKYFFSFREINYGSIVIESDHQPDTSEVVDAIMSGNAFIKDTEYEDVTFDKAERTKPKPEPSYER